MSLSESPPIVTSVVRSWLEAEAAALGSKPARQLAAVLANLGGDGKPFQASIEALNAAIGVKSLRGVSSTAAVGIAALADAGLIERVEKGQGGSRPRPPTWRLLMPAAKASDQPKADPAALHPRSLTPAARRIINDRLDGVYDPETGYVDDWTDKRLAEAIGVPLVWVAEVRELMFGPLKVNPAIEAEASAAIEVVNRTAARIDAAAKALADNAALIAELASENGKLAFEIKTLRADLDGARAAVRRVEEAVRP